MDVEIYMQKKLPELKAKSNFTQDDLKPVNYDRIVLYKQSEFYRKKLIKAGDPINLYLSELLYISSNVSNFEEKYHLMTLATQTMSSSNLDGLVTVKSIINLFDNNDYSGYIRIYQKGGNAEDFKHYKNFTSDPPQNQKLYNIGFCFRPTRKTKSYVDVYLSPLIKFNSFNMLTFLTNQYPKLQGLNSRYNILTPQNLKDIDRICVDFSKSGNVPSTNTPTPVFKKLVRNESIFNRMTHSWVEIEE